MDAVDGRRFHAVVIGQQFMEGQHLFIVEAENRRISAQAGFIVHDGMEAEFLDIKEVVHLFDGDDTEFIRGKIETVKKLGAHDDSPYSTKTGLLFSKRAMRARDSTRKPLSSNVLRPL